MQTEKNKRILANYKFSFFIAGCTIVLLIIHIIFFRNITYKSGLVGNPFYYLSYLPLILAVFGILAILSIIALINSIQIIFRSVKNRKFHYKKFIFAISPLLFVLSYCLVETHTEVSGPGAWRFLRGYEKWVEKEVDIPAIRKWLVELPDQYSDQDYFEAKAFPEPLPDVILHLDPYHMYLSEFEEGQRAVTFEWGCALGHFGMVIGLPEMETPEKEELIKHSDHDFEFRRPIEPGVYIFERG